MKWLMLLLLVAACNENASPLKSENGKVDVPPVIQSKSKTDLSRFPWVVEELQSEMEMCGEGVILGEDGLSKGENRCSYQVKVDDLLLMHPSQKTGLIHEPGWQFKEGVTFYVPNEEVKIPDNFNLVDKMTGGRPAIKQQQCGDCWAWATHHGLEISRAVHDKKAVDYSSQHVLSCSQKGSCGGGYMSAVDFLSHGLPFEEQFPYLGGKTGRCKWSSDEINAGWPPKPIGTPWIGDSKSHSRGAHLMSAEEKKRADGAKVTNMMRAMVQNDAPLVVTVAAFSISGSGVYNSCSQINSGGNHMVDISGFEMKDGVRVAHVYNSWGTSFGDGGIGKIKWECGDGRLNRGLGVEAKVVQYKSPCTPAVAFVGKPEHLIIQGTAAKLGRKLPPELIGKVKCSWLPVDGLSHPNECETYAEPMKSTEYHLTATNDCGSSSAMTLVRVLSEGGKRDNVIVTPYGEVQE